MSSLMQLALQIESNKKKVIEDKTIAQHHAFARVGQMCQERVKREWPGRRKRKKRGGED
jgi:hypothetical protein